MLPTFLARRVRPEPFHGAACREPALTEFFFADGGLLATARGVRLGQGALPLALAREICRHVPIRAKRHAQSLARGPAIALAPKGPESPAVLPQGGGVVVVLLEQRPHVVVEI